MAAAGAGDMVAAREAYVAGLAATGDAPALGVDLAALLERLAQPEEAIEVYQRLHAANPSSELLANNLAMLLTTYRSDPTSFDRAYDLVRSFRNSDVPAFLNTYGWVRYKQGNLDEAVTYLRRAAADAPENPVMRYHLGMALLERGEVEAARAELGAAVAAEQGFVGKDEARKALQALGDAQG
jgi:Flp pilus assembly protein TadD